MQGEPQSQPSAISSSVRVRSIRAGVPSEVTQEDDDSFALVADDGADALPNAVGVDKLGRAERATGDAHAIHRHAAAAASGYDHTGDSICATAVLIHRCWCHLGEAQW